MRKLIYRRCCHYKVDLINQEIKNSTDLFNYMKTKEEDIVNKIKRKELKKLYFFDINFQEYSIPNTEDIIKVNEVIMIIPYILKLNLEKALKYKELIRCNEDIKFSKNR